ncbi:MAG: hypothetical protein KatS3mg032_1329 [Cyclobacteriaceae bacterium]|nr:MAG: hypothetical protein KatS3mg032_1329 [Cyclobacteriaceae bacterium]
MRNLWFVVVPALMTACTEVSFKEPQPQGVKSLKAVPQKLQGTFMPEQDGLLAGKIVIYANGYRVEKSDASEPAEVYPLSDSLVLKYYKGYYFVSLRDESAWLLRVVKPQKDGSLMLMEMPALSEEKTKRQEQLNALRKIAPVTETEIRGSAVYIMEPTPKQLLRLLREGYFSKQTLLRRETSG